MVDLDDAADLVAHDNGRLLAIARAGATVRQIADPAGWIGHADIRADEIGAAGVIVSELLPAAYGAALAGLSTRFGAPIAAPLSGLEPGGAFPRAADVVVILSVNGLERRLVDSVHLAASRGATTIVAAPEGSPIAVAAAERRVTLVTFNEDEPIAAWWAAVAALVAVFRGAAALDALADALDESAALLGPVVETFRNPAKQIALLEGPLLVVALDDDAVLAAPLLAQEVGMRSPWSARSVDARHTFTQLLGYLDSRAGGSGGDLFYDPQIDGPQGPAPVRQLVLLSGASSTGPSDEALDVAERIGTVRAVEFGTDERWNAMTQILLAQLSGTYYTLVND